MLIITNNLSVKYSFSSMTKYYDQELKKILLIVRGYVLNGHILLSHPLSGSIKPNETYYKSIIVSTDNSEYVDIESLNFIDNAIEVYDRFMNCKKRPLWSDSILLDFRKIDYYLIMSALESANIVF